MKKIEYIPTLIGENLLLYLKNQKYKIKNNYPNGAFDKGIDFDSYIVMIDDQEVLFEWTNWFEWSVSSLPGILEKYIIPNLSPLITCSIDFNHVRTTLPMIDYEGKYRPHIVIESRTNTQVTQQDGYIGVQFIDVEENQYKFILPYYPRQDHHVTLEDEFTVREGGTIVGSGVVIDIRLYKLDKK